ncbi:hypothetical protein [Streptomyces sp. NPDC048338]|uniref:hypothetical protein n=1 Tax=Streptomyces sp. NPDC048338 TaxID=3365536 RepID=UPI003722B8C9
MCDAWDFWLSQHDISTPELIETAVKEATSAWLDANTDRLIAAVAEVVARQAGGNR